MHQPGSFEDHVLQEAFERERNERAQFASLVVSAIFAATRVLVSAKPGETYTSAWAEVQRLLSMYEAEVHQDFYRPNVQAAIRSRLSKREASDNQRRALFDEALNDKLTSLTYEP